MPIYEYRCGACGADFEKLQRVSDAPPVCPRCAASDVARRVSLSSFQLKGTGWYSTDYKAAPAPAAADAGKAAESKSSAATPDGPAASESSDSTAKAPAAAPATPPAST